MYVWTFRALLAQNEALPKNLTQNESIKRNSAIQTTAGKKKKLAPRHRPQAAADLLPDCDAGQKLLHDCIKFMNDPVWEKKIRAALIVRAERNFSLLKIKSFAYCFSHCPLQISLLCPSQTRLQSFSMKRESDIWAFRKLLRCWRPQCVLKKHSPQRYTTTTSLRSWGKAALPTDSGTEKTFLLLTHSLVLLNWRKHLEKKYLGLFQSTFFSREGFTVRGCSWVTS